jgi:hypothetical protein
MHEGSAVARAISVPHTSGGHCASSAFRDLLEHNGLSFTGRPLSEAMVFGLAGGLDFRFGQPQRMDPPVWITGRSATLESDLCTHIGADAELRQTDDPEVGWRWVAEKLDRGEPALIWADIHELSYLQVHLHNTWHDLIVVDHDAERRTATVLDFAFDEPQECTLESLARARCADAMPAGANRHATWFVDFPEALPDARETIVQAVRRAVANMRPDAENDPFRWLGEPGLAGLELFVDDFAAWATRDLDLREWLRRIRLLVERAGTGGGLFRNLYAGFLAEAGELLDDPALTEAADVYRRAAEGWSEAVRIPAAADLRAVHREAVPRLAGICQLERVGVELLDAWVSRQGAGGSRWIDTTTQEES